MLIEFQAYLRGRREEILMLLGIPLLAIACHLPEISGAWVSRVALFLFSTALVLLHAYTFNDWANFKFDISDPSKKDQPWRTGIVCRNEILALSLLAFLAGIGICVWFFPRMTLFICLLIELLWILYSSRLTLLKSVPVLSTFLHLVEGTLFFILGSSLFSSPAGKSWATGLFFGLLYASAHLGHETIDFEGDLRAGLKTNAITFGLIRTFWASFGGVTLSTLYIFFLGWSGRACSPRIGVVFGLAYLIYCGLLRLAWKEGLNHRSLTRFRSRCRKLYSTAGLVTLLWLLL